MNSVKDVKPGAANCRVLGCGDNASDHAHVSRTTPFQTKRKEVMNDPQYQAEAIGKSREMKTTQRGRDKEVKPI